MSRQRRPRQKKKLLDAETVDTLQFCFLRARTPLTAAQLAYLTSTERLVFRSAPLSAAAKKRPRHQPASAR